LPWHSLGLSTSGVDIQAPYLIAGDARNPDTTAQLLLYRSPTRMRRPATGKTEPEGW